MSSTTLDTSRKEETRSAAHLQVIVVGAGALGNEVVKTLAQVGAGKITIVDPDVVEPSNLTSSVLFRAESAVGKNKAEALAGTLRQWFPEIEVEAVPAEIADVGLQKLARNDLLFSCVDNNLARLEIAYSVQRVGLKMVDGGLASRGWARGRVSVFPGGDAACFSCLLPARARAGLLSRLRAPSGSCGSGGLASTFIRSTPVMASIVASMQVNFGLALAVGESDEAFSCDIALSPQPRLERVSLRRSNTCPFHQLDGMLLDAPGAGTSGLVRDLFDRARLGGDLAALVLDWPICAAARCRSCGQRWSPMCRVSVVRRSGICPRCGSRGIDEIETLRSIMPGSRWFDCTLTELGLPEEHLYTIRRAQ